MGTLTIEVNKAVESEALRIAKILGATSICIRPSEIAVDLFLYTISGPTIPSKKENVQIYVYRKINHDSAGMIESVKELYSWGPIV